MPSSHPKTSQDIPLRLSPFVHSLFSFFLYVLSVLTFIYLDTTFHVSRNLIHSFLYCRLKGL